jgi:Tfp pilus assembly protein PilO
MKPPVISGIIVFALTFYIGRGIYSKQTTVLNSMQQQLTEKSQVQDISSEISSSIVELRKLQKRLSPAMETELLIQEVGRIAQEEGVVLNSIIPGLPRSIGEFTQLSVALRLKADYHKLGKLISSIENSPMFIRVDRVNINRREPDAMAEVNLSLSSLYAMFPNSY